MSDSVSSEKIKTTLYIVIAICSLCTIASGFAVQYSASKGYGVRISALETITQRHAVDEAGYKKDIEQIRKDVTELKDQFRGDVEELKTNNVKILEILLGR